MLPFVSVVLVVPGDSQDWAACLAALEAQSYEHDRYEVLAIANRQLNPGPEFAHLRWLATSDRRPYARRNLGVEASRGEVLAFTDSNCLPDSGWLEEGVRKLQLDGSSLVAGQIQLFAGDSQRPTAVERFEMLSSLRQDVDVGHGVASITNLFADRAVLMRLRFRDGLLKADWDLCRRARLAGLPLVYAAAARVRQPAIASLGDLRASKHRLALGRWQLAAAWGQSRGRARLAAIWEAHPPLKALLRTASDPRIGGWNHRLALMGVTLASRLTYLEGWLRAELSGPGCPSRSQALS